MRTKCIHLYTSNKINQDKLFSFFKEIDLKPLGTWDNDELDVKYNVFVNSNNEFNKALKNKIGLSYIVKFNNRELMVSMFEIKNKNYEIIIYLNSLDLNQRPLLFKKLKSYFLEKNFFEGFIYDSDDDSHEIDISSIYDLLKDKLPKSIKLFMIKNNKDLV